MATRPRRRRRAPATRALSHSPAAVVAAIGGAGRRRRRSPALRRGAETRAAAASRCATVLGPSSICQRQGPALELRLPNPHNGGLMETFTYAIVTLVCFALSAFFSASETGLLRLRATELEA